jgi:hypothetical protein
LIQLVPIFCFQIRNGGNAASLLAGPAASGDAFASPQGGRKKMRLPCERRSGRLPSFLF